MSEATAIEAFNSERAAQLLRDKVRSAFVELMPADEWERMIKAEIQAFLAPRTVRTNIGSSYSPRYEEEIRSPFREIAHEELGKYVKENKELREVLRTEVAAAVSQRLDAEFPEMVKEMVLNGIKTALQSASYRLGEEISSRVSQYST